MTHGPATALAIPTYEDLVLPLERHVYWAQHLLILLIPFYLMLTESDRREDPSCRMPRDQIISWPHVAATFSFWLFWHFIVMQVQLGKKTKSINSFRKK